MNERKESHKKLLKLTNRHKRLNEFSQSQAERNNAARKIQRGVRKRRGKNEYKESYKIVEKAQNTLHMMIETLNIAEEQVFRLNEELLIVREENTTRQEIVSFDAVNNELNGVIMKNNETLKHTMGALNNILKYELNRMKNSLWCTLNKTVIIKSSNKNQYTEQYKNQPSNQPSNQHALDSNHCRTLSSTH